MRVLHVIPSLATRTGGPAVAVVNACRALEAAGVRTTIAATDMPGPAGAAPGALTLPAGSDALDLRLFPARPPRRLAFSPGLYRMLMREAAVYDVVHVHSLFLFPQFAAYRAARARGVPYVVSPRGALDPCLRPRGRARKALVDALWQRAWLEGAAALHCTSHAEARDIAHVAPRVPRYIVPNAVELEAFGTPGDRAAFRRRWLPEAPGAPLVLCHGRIAAKKRLDVLVRALALLRREADVRLVLAGPDDDRLAVELRARAAAEGVAQAVTFTGMLGAADVRAALAAADVWALPSAGENFGNAVAEAFAAGCAVVATPQVEVAADAAREGAAVTVEATPAAFAAAISTLLADRARRERVGEAARTFAQRYALERVGVAMRAMYEAIARRA
jgi:glycosyltransferase involved in cell wall biosynthesis